MKSAKPKAATSKEVVHAVPEALPPAVRILKVATCPSLSGRSTLTYHLGGDAPDNLKFRVTANSGSGQFNADWVALAAIRKLLDQHPADKPLTSALLKPVFRGRSSNSPAFLFAVLKAEGLVKAAAEKDEGYLTGDFDAFQAEASALIAAGTDLAVASESPTEPPKKKRPVKASGANPESE